MRKLLIAGAALALMSGAAMAQVAVIPTTPGASGMSDNGGGPSNAISTTTQPGQAPTLDGSVTVTTGYLGQGHIHGSDSSSR
jgi:hypothetical protein